MTNQNDSFIDEVTEEVRRDKLFAMFRKYGWIGVVAIVAVVAGAAFVEWQRHREAVRSQAFGDSLIGALQSEEPAARLAALGDVPADGGQTALLALTASAEAVEAGDSERAIALLDPVASDATLAPAYRHLALLRKVVIAGDTMPAAEREAALAELSAPGAPYRPLAVEQQALALVAEGKTADALAILNQLVQDAEATAALRRRASQLIVALGGEIQSG